MNIKWGAGAILVFENRGKGQSSNACIYGEDIYES